MRSKKTSFPISIRIIFIFLLLFIPVILLGSNIYRHGYHIIKNEIKNSSQAQLTLYAQSLEDEILRIQRLQSEYVMEQDLDYIINAYPILDQYERSQYLLQIQERLRILKESSKFIGAIHIHIPSLEKTISFPGGIDLLESDWQISLQHLKSPESSGLTFDGGNIYMDMQYPLNVAEEKQPLFIMEITLSNPEILKMLEGFNQYPDSSIYLEEVHHNYLLSTDSQIPSLNSDGYDSKSFEADHVITTTVLDSAGMRLASIVPTSQIYGKIANYRWIFLCYVIFSLIIIIIFGLMIHRMIHRPVNDLIQAIHQVEDGNYSVTVVSSREDEFHYLNQAFNKMTENLQELIHEVYEQKILMQNIELKQLQSQINPHFLYNSFFNIYRLAKDEDYENLTAFTQYLGTYYQYITRNASPEVPLIEEYNHARTYCNIQQMRFHNRLELRMDPLPEDFHKIYVPRLIMQPIIENAFEHGLKTVESPRLEITFSHSDDYLYITISDNGPALDDDIFAELHRKLESSDTALETTAIINIHRRLHLKFGPLAGLKLSNGNLGGLQIIVQIPLTDIALSDTTFKGGD